METADRIGLGATADLRSRVNEKLLQALLGLLALKDEHFLQELCIVFDAAQKGEGAIPPEVWRGVHKHLGALMGLAADTDDQPTH
jgi:hypothetical protein